MDEHKCHSCLRYARDVWISEESSGATFEAFIQVELQGDSTCLLDLICSRWLGECSVHVASEEVTRVVAEEAESFV